MVPVGAKTADITFKYLNTNYLTLTPYAITQISQTVGGITTIINSPEGPAGVPTLSGANDALVKYCVYVTNIATSGTLNFQLRNPVTGSLYGTCFYDANCIGNCNSTGGVLAVQFIDFKGKKNGSTVLLEWATTNEINTRAFEIEKSNDGRQFNGVATQQAAGTGSVNYNYTDNQPFAGSTFHRLKVINSTRDVQYSNVIQVKDNASFSINKIQPNLFVDKITIEVSLEKAAPLYIQLLDVNGKVIAKKQVIGIAGVNNINLTDLSLLTKAVYIIKITSDNNKWMQKLIK